MNASKETKFRHRQNCTHTHARKYEYKWNESMQRNFHRLPNQRGSFDWLNLVLFQWKAIQWSESPHLIVFPNGISVPTNGFSPLSMSLWSRQACNKSYCMHLSTKSISGFSIDARWWENCNITNGIKKHISEILHKLKHNSTHTHTQIVIII